MADLDLLSAASCTFSPETDVESTLSHFYPAKEKRRRLTEQDSRGSKPTIRILKSNLVGDQVAFFETFTSHLIHFAS
jgi:hypothetical protein